jgi:peptidoglycan hydrolase-like amidase
MALPSSGTLSINMIRNELGQSSGSLGYLSDWVGFNAPDRISDFYGYSNAPANSVTFSSSYSYTGSGSASYSGTVTIVGATATFNARSTSTGNFTTDTIININGNSRRARITTAGTLNSTTFSLGPGTYSYTFSCQVTGGGTGIGQIIFTQ